MKDLFKNASSKKHCTSKVQPSVLEYTPQIPKCERIQKTPQGEKTMAGKRREGEERKKKVSRICGTLVCVQWENQQT